MIQKLLQSGSTPTELEKQLKIPRQTAQHIGKQQLETSGNFPKSRNRNKAGAGRKVGYPDLENQVLQWTLEQIDKNLAVHRDCIKAKAKNLKPPNCKLKFSNGWLKKFMRRNELSLIAKTSQCQKLPEALEARAAAFYEELAKLKSANIIPLSLIINMDETPIYFDSIPNRTVQRKGARECIIRTTGSGRKHVTAALSVSAAGDILPSMLIFKGIRPLKLREEALRDGIVQKVQPKAWMDEEKMHDFLDEILIPYVEKKKEDLGLDNVSALFISDAFSAHKVGSIRSKLISNGIVPLFIPAGTTSKLQPLDVSINKPFKQILRCLWVDYMQANVDIGETIKPPSHSDIIKWVDEALKSLSSHPTMVKRSFEATGITLKESVVSNERLKSALSICSDSLVAQFGEKLDSENFTITISDELYE